MGGGLGVVLHDAGSRARASRLRGGTPALRRGRLVVAVHGSRVGTGEWELLNLGLLRGPGLHPT
jgi:hypothetical protein